jgi:hypothetical protein
MPVEVALHGQPVVVDFCTQSQVGDGSHCAGIGVHV